MAEALDHLELLLLGGSSPVTNVDHAVGVKAGIVERSGPNVPSRASREIVDSFPSAMRRRTSS